MREILEKGLLEFGISYPQGVDKLISFGELLLEKNKVMNLTAITEPSEVATKHFLDCASLLTVHDFKDKTVIDVGCGAGFPSMPLKILCPEADVTLLDSLNKRINFLNECLVSLELTEKSHAVHGRAEEFARKNREVYDFAVSRAVTNLTALAELCLPYVKVGGKMVCMKSVNSDDEIRAARQAIRLLGGGEMDIVDIKIPFTDITHRIITVEKVKTTPAKYPRSWGKIQSNPL